jgi:hypothetical protein
MRTIKQRDASVHGETGLQDLAARLGCKTWLSGGARLFDFAFRVLRFNN